jgi:glyoxylate/hydroxypyruvate reductase A
MVLLFLCPGVNPVGWSRELAALMPELELRIWPEVGDVTQIDAALVWQPPPGELQRLPGLRLIQCLGMGVDGLLADSTLPPVPVARMFDPGIVTQMAEYVCEAVLYHHRRLADYAALQRERRWQRLPWQDTVRRRVGILGLGEIGAHTARQVQRFGFAVAGWSRSPKVLEYVAGFYGDDTLPAFLQRTDILVCLLPLTPTTRDILGARELALLPAGACVINCARGEHLVEADLLAALDSGHLAGATLDVFRQEPLPPDHPFWTHPKIRVTPHVAGLTHPRTAAPLVVENLRRLQAGEPLLHRVDRVRGY